MFLILGLSQMLCLCEAFFKFGTRNTKCLAGFDLSETLSLKLLPMIHPSTTLRWG